MAKQTQLYEQHVACGARMVDFHGWMMPLHYGSQLEEHQAVRQEAGMFDVSHMTIVDLHGARTREFLRYLLANDVTKLTVPGKALYTGMLTASGGVIDDLIVYFLTEDYFRLVVNSATREKDLAWIAEHAEPYGVTLTERQDLALVAVQGPQAKEKAATVFTAEQKQAIAGQGFNLGLRDVMTLAETLAAAFAQGQDVGSYHVLSQYQQRRQPDQQATVAVTDGLIHLFANRYTPLVVGRNLGLIAMERMPALRDAFTRRTLGWVAR